MPRPRKEGNTVAVSKAQQKAVHKYVKANYDRMELTVPKGQKEAIKAHAEARGESVNGFVNRAISEAMERDNGAPAASEGLEKKSPRHSAQGLTWWPWWPIMNIERALRQAVSPSS